MDKRSFDTLTRSLASRRTGIAALLGAIVAGATATPAVAGRRPRPRCRYETCGRSCCSRGEICMDRECRACAGRNEACTSSADCCPNTTLGKNTVKCSAESCVWI